MLKIRGVAVFLPNEKALLKMDGIDPHQIIATRPQHLDELEVQVEHHQNSLTKLKS